MVFLSSAVQVASQLARAEPSSEAKKSKSKIEVPRSLTNNTAPALFHVRPCCAVYRLPGCSSLFSGP